MKKYLPLIALLLAVGYVAGSLRAPKNPAAFDVVGFSKLPVLVNGRVKPVDTVARSSLLQLQGRQTVTTPDNRSLLPIEWLLDVVHHRCQGESLEVELYPFLFLNAFGNGPASFPDPEMMVIPMGLRLFRILPSHHADPTENSPGNVPRISHPDQNCQ